MTKCLIKYAEDPTYISSRIVDQWEAAIPAITVCPEYNGLKLDVLQVRLVRKKLLCEECIHESFFFKGKWYLKC